MNRLVVLICIILSFVVGFGQWYLMTWFLTSESDPLKWSIIVKIVYLIFSGLSTESLQKIILNGGPNKNDNNQVD